MPASHHPNILVERDEHIATVTIDNPQSKNACTGDMWVALGASFRDLAHSGVRVIVLTGANGNFCTGADLSGAAETASSGPSGKTCTACASWATSWSPSTTARFQ